MALNPHKHIKGGDGCIPLFCTACAYEEGHRAGFKVGLRAMREPVGFPYYTDAEMRWFDHCARMGRPRQWTGPHGSLP